MEELLRTILNTVTSTDKKVDDILQWKGSIDTRCQMRGETLNNIANDLYDKEKGLFVRVQQLHNCKESINSTKQFFTVILQKVMTWGLIGLIVWLLMMYKKN